MIEASVRKVNGGRKIAEETAQAMASIGEEIGQVAQRIHNINTASSEQSVGIAQINQGIIQVSQVVQMSSVTARQSASTSEQLNRRAETLQAQVSRLLPIQNMKDSSCRVFSLRTVWLCARRSAATPRSGSLF